ncbi:putative undecaprenyl-phosphate N-acetylglucosaminyl 1-phosphate transferase [Clostridium tepidiprofundi DSM 19306]|uniref:Putative undecaprenyl-phosphate N-acetylglucosaminyl 1-phosphate transferase n=1 Tax=Clostridium tepidiprofundi DSM 19306 TaxID=1121338 RepID=A0A151B4T3_9CLOT|nr:MraY family glycosyltransferase [Clostridium tepidiprofundi]KYH34918.1 putative undecaprenyl-phosphate N-acetylglucosaminyl 1-phosphate transferase [Clostridium tepidiprofundi DSM 19306]
MNKLSMMTLVIPIISFIVTPIVQRIAIKINAIDVPKDNRRIHKKPVPLLGGLAIYISFIIGVILKNGHMTSSEVGIVLGATIITFGGFIDDLRDIKPVLKLFIQLFAATILIIYGVRIGKVTNPVSSTSFFIDLGRLSVPLTIFWVVGVTNAFNLIDGLDGLSAGIALIASVTLFIISILNGRVEAAILTSILSSALIGFLPYNFYPATIFMGDTGSQLLGFLLAAISIEGTIKSATAFALGVPILIFGVPIYDTLFAIIRRKINGKPIMQADKGHLHHRLLDIGLTQKQTVIVMYLISAILGGISIIAMQMSTQRSYFLVTIVILIISFVAWKNNFFQHKE